MEDMKNAKEKQQKLVVYIIAITVLIIAILNTANVLIVRGRTRASVAASYDEDCRKITEAYAEVVSIRLSEYIKQMRMYTEADITKTADPHEIQSWLIAHEKSRTSDFDRIGYIDEKGDFYNDQNKITNVVDREYFLNVMKNGKDIDIDDPVTSKSTGATIIHVSAAAKVNGKTSGVYSAVVGVDKLTEFVSQIRIGSTGYVVLFNSKGGLIATSAPDRDDEEKSEAMGKALSVIADALIQRRTGAAWIDAGKFGKKYVTYKPVENANWGLAFVIDESQVFKTADEISLSIAISGVFMIAFLCLGIGIAVFKALKPLEIVKQAIEGIAAGEADLTQRITNGAEKSKTEIGGVVRGFNDFMEKLQDIIKSIKNTKAILVDSGEQLRVSTQDTAASITEIISNIQSMGNNITAQSNSVQSTAGAVHQIASNIESLNKMIGSQVESVADASSAVEQMIGNIAGVNNSVEKMADSFSTLEARAVSGAKKQEDVTHKISQIQSESESLQEANSVISAIAEQTNLLAMNAAIEAAHAGEAGKGFSVVADEIRKLSETSSEQSRTIGEQLQKIHDSINQIALSSGESRDAFASVTDGIHTTDSLVRQIKNAMEEQTEGSKHIIDALHLVNDNSASVKAASEEMRAGNTAILAEIQSLQDAALSMKTGMDEMSIGAKKINDTGATLSELSDRMEISIDEIGNQIDMFDV